MHIRQIRLFCVALLSSSAVSVALCEDSHVDHAEFTAAKTSYTIELRDKDDKKIVVAWKSVHYDEYKLVVTRDASARVKPISLYNLGLQGRLWEVKIDSAKSVNADGSPGTVAILNSNGDPVTLTLPLTIPPTNKSDNMKCESAADPNGVWFLSFSGKKCVITVKVDGGHPAHGRPIKMPGAPFPITSHDGFPDPPYSGSES